MSEMLSKMKNKLDKIENCLLATCNDAFMTHVIYCGGIFCIINMTANAKLPSKSTTVKRRVICLTLSRCISTSCGQGWLVKGYIISCYLQCDKPLHPSEGVSQHHAHRAHLYYLTVGSFWRHSVSSQWTHKMTNDVSLLLAFHQFATHTG